VVLDHVANWQIYALQTEEERGEGPFCLPLWIEHSENVTVANYHGYRVVSSYQPFLNAIHVADSKNIRFRNVHVYGDNKVSFDNSLVIDGASPLMIRNRELAALDVDTTVTPVIEKAKRSTVLADGAKVERLTGGFYNVSGAAVDGAGRLYFVDAHWQRIYRWLPDERRAEIVRDSPLDPVQLAFDKAGNLMVVSYAGKGTVYWFRPDARDLNVAMIEPQKTAARPGMTPVLPVNYWRNENDFVKSIPTQRAYQFVSPDGTTFIPAGEDFVTGALYYGTKMADVLRAFSLGMAAEGKLFYVSDESAQKTYSANVEPDGTLTDMKLFADVGGENVAQDADGNVYIAAGQVYVYSPSGELIDRIDVPERPVDLAFGGKDGKTLYILARTSLYSVETRAKGL
jgi:sugar lactone lactonase YvrE